MEKRMAALALNPQNIPSLNANHAKMEGPLLRIDPVQISPSENGPKKSDLKERRCSSPRKTASRSEIGNGLCRGAGVSEPGAMLAVPQCKTDIKGGPIRGVKRGGF